MQLLPLEPDPKGQATPNEMTLANALTRMPINNHIQKAPRRTTLTPRWLPKPLETSGKSSQILLQTKSPSYMWGPTNTYGCLPWDCITAFQ